MRLWRVSNYADLSGEGGRRFPARWHSAGRPIVYCAESPAGALVEHLVHLDWDLLPSTFQLLTIDIGDETPVGTVSLDLLPEDWRSHPRIARATGDAWLTSGLGLLLRVPSAILPDTWNVLFNPSHAEAAGARIVKTEKVPLDPRFGKR